MLLKLKRSLVFIFASTLFSYTYGQKDPSALELLQQLENKVNAYKSLKTSFEYILEKPQEGDTETYKGEVLIKGDKYKLSIDQTQTYCDGKTRWVYLTESNEENVSNLTKEKDMEPEEKFLNDPLSLFTIYKDGFKYQSLGHEDLDGKSYQVIDLSPEDLNKAYFKIRYWFSDAFQLYDIRYFQKDGTRMTLKLLTYEPDVKVKDSDFVFRTDNYPGVEVIDIRE